MSKLGPLIVSNYSVMKIVLNIKSIQLIAPIFLNTRDGNYIDPPDEEDEPGQESETDGKVEYQNGTDEILKIFTHAKCVMFKELKCL